MTFNEGAQLDTSQVQSGGGGIGGGGGGIAVGGVGGIILLILSLLFGGNITGGDGNPGSQGGGGGGGFPMDTQGIGAAGTGGDDVSQRIAQCKTGADANRDDVCLVVGTVNSVQNFWRGYLPSYGKSYQDAPTVIYSGSTRTACGTGSSAMGPFYCPLDNKVYIDASFFNELDSKYGADSGPLAKEYVVAHEYGHHVQNLIGTLGAAQQDPQGPESGAVRVELQADCFGGVWVRHATQTKDAQGRPLLKPITESDIRSALSAASAVGDDRIQQKSQGRVTPENFTHGTSQQRMKWFMQGYQTGDLNKCDTLNAPDPG